MRLNLDLVWPLVGVYDPPSYTGWITSGRISSHSWWSILLVIRVEVWFELATQSENWTEEHRNENDGLRLSHYAPCIGQVLVRSWRSWSRTVLVLLLGGWNLKLFIQKQWLVKTVGFMFLTGTLFQVTIVFIHLGYWCFFHTSTNSYFKPICI